MLLEPGSPLGEVLRRVIWGTLVRKCLSGICWPDEPGCVLHATWLGPLPDLGHQLAKVELRRLTVKVCSACGQVNPALCVRFRKQSLKN
jgi:hypothetical protein